MRTFATVLAVLAVSLTFAQGAGPGGGQGRPGGGQGRMGAGAMQESRMTLLMRPDVQQELKITAEQRQQIQAAMPQRGQGGQAGGGQQGGGQAGAGQGRGQGGGQGAGQGGGAQMGEINAKIKEVLTPEQWDRLTGLYIQRAGNSAVMDQEIAKAVNLTDSQKASIQQAQQEQRQKMMEMMQEARQNGGDMAAMAEMRTKMQAEMNETIGGILTTEQKAMLREMRGEPFTFQGGGAGRGGAGGGAGARGGAGGGGN